MKNWFSDENKNKTSIYQPFYEMCAREIVPLVFNLGEKRKQQKVGVRDPTFVFSRQSTFQGEFSDLIHKYKSGYTQIESCMKNWLLF